MRHPARPAALVLVFLAITSLDAALARAQVTDIVGHLPTGDFTTYIAPQSYRDWGNEPCVAVNPLDPQQIVVSSFGYGSWISRSTAQLWYSTNGGVNWDIRFSVPTPIAGVNFFVDDQTYAFDSSGVLHCALLVEDAGTVLHVYHGVTTNVTTSAAWTWNATPLGATSPDQPYLALAAGRVAIAFDEFSAPNGVEQRVALSTNNGTTFPAALNLPVGSPGGAPNNTGGSPNNFINPGLRVAMDSLGRVFVIYGMATNGSSGVPLMNYRLNRYSSGPGWDFTSATPDAIGGLAITNGLSRQGTVLAYAFGAGQNALLGNITAIAVNTNGSQVYAAYGLTGTNGIGRLFLQPFQPSGTNLIRTGAPLAFSATNFNAALPSMAVAPNGMLGILFDEYDGTSFHVHFALSSDQGQTIKTNLELYSFTTNGMVLGYGTANHNRILGDYHVLMAQGNTFYGAFAGRGNINGGSNNTTNFIDPFFFSLSAVIPAVRPALSQPVKSSGTFQFILTGEANVTYVIQASSDFQSWTPVATNTAATTTRLVTVNTTNAWNYYRAATSQ